HCIATIRVDYLGRCGELVVNDQGLRLDRVAYGEDHRVFVAQLHPEQLRAAIVKPAAQVGLQLEAGLADRMLADVGQEPGALPLLEDTLDLVWQRSQGNTLTQAAYEEVGGVSGALRMRADALVASLSPEQQHITRRLMVRLVSIGTEVAVSTRHRVLIS